MYALAFVLEYRVSKGVRELPGNFQSATSNVPSGKALMYFGLFLATGVFFIFIAFTMFLPVMVLMPQKFAICFTLGCCFIIGSFFALKGPKNQLAHMFSKEVCLIFLLLHFYQNPVDILADSLLLFVPLFYDAETSFYSDLYW